MSVPVSTVRLVLPSYRPLGRIKSPILAVQLSQSSRRCKSTRQDINTKGNPLLEKYLKRQAQVKEEAEKQRHLLSRQPERGDVAPESIINQMEIRMIQRRQRRMVQDTTATSKPPTSPDRKGATPTPTPTPTPTGIETEEPRKISAISIGERDWDNLAMALDPEPTRRARWQARMLTQHIRRGGRLTREQALRRTERQCSSASMGLKTSTKKLGFLARQIAGKTVEEALVQMRFSKKRVAQDVMRHLEHARNEAIVKWGMGLGKSEGTKGKHPIEIQLKDGKRKLIKDKTDIYIDRAWVGKGPHGTEIDYRARGKAFMMKKPYSRITLLLKEETTRIRLSEEMQKKKENRKLWLHLPDRPIPQQRQYPLW